MPRPPWMKCRSKFRTECKSRVTWPIRIVTPIPSKHPMTKQITETEANRTSHPPKQLNKWMQPPKPNWLASTSRWKTPRRKRPNRFNRSNRKSWTRSLPPTNNSNRRIPRFSRSRSSSHCSIQSWRLRKRLKGRQRPRKPSGNPSKQVSSWPSSRCKTGLRNKKRKGTRRSRFNQSIWKTSKNKTKEKVSRLIIKFKCSLQIRYKTKPLSINKKIHQPSSK